MNKAQLPVRGLAIRSIGMVSPLGLNAPASCAAVRARLSRFQEVAFHDQLGEPIIASPALEAVEDQQGYRRILPMLRRALNECLSARNLPPASRDLGSIPLLLAIDDADRPDYPPTLPQWLFDELGKAGLQFHSASAVFSEGKVGFFRALDQARKVLESGTASACLVAGADSLVNSRALAWLEDREALKTGLESDGVIPGEAAAVFLLTLPEDSRSASPQITGIGFGAEQSVLEADAPNLGTGLAQAMRAALEDARMPLVEVDFRVGYMTGEREAFREATLALARVQRVHKDLFELWLPAEKLGDTGAALPACMLAVTVAGIAKRYAPGPTAILFAASRGASRAASIVRGPAHGL